MGLMHSLRAVEDAGQLVITPDPVTLEGQNTAVCDLIPGETLFEFLSRHVDPSEPWEVTIGGVIIPVEHWGRIRPKHGQVIHVRGAVGRQAVALVAMIALNYFTFGAGSIVGIGGAWAGAGAYVAAGAIWVAGAALINNVLTPELPKAAGDQRDSVHAIGAARNAVRRYEPFALLFGHRRITPDYASAPYTWYEGDDMYLAMVLNVGINVEGVGELYNVDTLLSSYEGVEVFYNGIPGKPNQVIPLYSNADTVNGGALDTDQAWVVRTTPPDTVRVQVNVEGTIGDRDSKGRDHPNSEIIEAHYRALGDTVWQGMVNRIISNANDKNFELQRVTMSRDLPRGQYEVRVKRHFTAKDKSKGNWSAESEFQWTNMVAVQADEASYAGLGRIGIRVKATGQLTGAMDQLRLDAWSRPVPVWTGTAWVTESTRNPGAHLLQWFRGIKDEHGKLIAGYGLDDDEIDIPSLQAFMVHCAANGYSYSHYQTDARGRLETANAIARAGFGAISRETGRTGVVWAADGQPISGVVNMATIKKGRFEVGYNLYNAADGIEATYFDRTTWAPATIRVAAPGVHPDAMLNPAQLQLEGVTEEGHAAELTRWHLGQSLYQFKDINYGTDEEHLGYKRMDVLAISHDLTQWGYSGRLMGLAGNTVTLNEPVPPNATAHIGIRVPGEKAYRVMRVANFTGEPRDTVTLLDAWPSDAPRPTAENAHDYIWIYDFKATPGYRVRVVGKTLESDAKGASVAVVPESPEFWTYVKTGEYTPPQGGSLLNTLPKARNARVSEVQVVTGDVIHTELSVLFDIKGQAARSVIFAGITGTEIRPVVETVTNQVRFRIGSAGTYTILVRPYSVDGIAGEAASVVYSTVGADIPPPAFDWFTVTVEPGGLRRYAWGYSQFQPADLAGAEIRFSAEEGTPAWEAMTPLGEDGFFTSAFESDVPASGDWTFAIRARNTSGELSPAVYVRETLTHNVGENIEDHEDRINTVSQIAQEMLSDFADMNQRIADVQAEAQQAAADLRADIDVLAGQLGDIMQADEWELEKEYPSGDLVQHGGKLYRALQDVPAETPITDTDFWEVIGEYSSLGEAVSAVIRQANHTATETEAHADMFTALGVMTPDGAAFLLNQDTVKVGPDESLGQRLSGISAEFDGVGARIDAEELARAGADDALSQRTEAMESRMPTESGDLATAQSVDQISNRVETVEGEVTAHSEQIGLNQAAIAGKADSSTVSQISNTVSQQGQTISAHGQELSGLSASVGDAEASINELREVSVGAITGNGAFNPSFELGAEGWGRNDDGTGALPSGVSIITGAIARSGDSVLAFTAAGGNVYNRAATPVYPQQTVRVGFYARTGNGAPNGLLRAIVVPIDAAGDAMGLSTVAGATLPAGTDSTPYLTAVGEYAPPAGAVAVRVAIQSQASAGGGNWIVDDVFVEPQSNTLAEMMAKWTFAVTAGIDIAGIQLVAGGGISAIRMMAAIFSIVDPDGTSGWTLENGVAVWRRNGWMKVIGPGFGANNEFIEWSGPEQSNLANCRRNNATSWESCLTGELFQRGGIISGTRVTSGFNPSLASPSTYTTPALGTGGNPIAVNASYSYSKHDTTSSISGRFTAGSGNNRATLELWRKIGSGSWQVVASTTANGSMDIVRTGDSSDNVFWNINGSIHYTDTAGGTQNRQYELRMSNRQLQNATHNGQGAVLIQEQSQAVGVITEEDP